MFFQNPNRIIPVMIFERPRAYHLATKIYSQLLEPRSLGLPTEHVSVGRVSGVLNLSCHSEITEANAVCRFEISPDWMNRPPRVVCGEVWVRRNIDWHVFKDSALCYVLDDEWRDQMEIFRKDCDLQDLEDIAVFWCLRNVRALLYKHRQAADLGIERWPSQWDFWEHGDRGRQDYILSKRRR